MLGEYNFSDENIRDALRVLLLKSGARNTLQNRGSQNGKKYVIPTGRSIDPLMGFTERSTAHIDNFQPRVDDGHLIKLGWSGVILP